MPRATRDDEVVDDVCGDVSMIMMMMIACTGDDEILLCCSLSQSDDVL